MTGESVQSRKRLEQGLRRAEGQAGPAWDVLDCYRWTYTNCFVGKIIEAGDRAEDRSPRTADGRPAAVPGLFGPGGCRGDFPGDADSRSTILP